MFSVGKGEMDSLSRRDSLLFLLVSWVWKQKLGGMHAMCVEPRVSYTSYPEIADYVYCEYS